MTDHHHRIITSLVFLIMLCLFGRQSEAQENNQPPKGFSALFNGEDLEGWAGGTTTITSR